MRRRIGLVYSVARRHTGDAQRAEDVAQRVFADLARKAEMLARRPVLIGWLYRSAQFAASDAMRAERRRLAREEEAHLMQTIEGTAPEPNWEKLRPVLDEALNDLDERDRDAVLLRFFDGRPFGEVGAKLQLTENAARMRVERALEKLQAALGRRGVTSTAAALGVVLAQPAGAIAPAGLAASMTGAALAGTAAGAGGWLTLFMSISKIQIGVALALAVAGTAGYVLQGKTNAALREEIVALQSQQQAVAALRTENRQLAGVVAEVEILRRDDGELKQLAQRADEVKKANEEKARVALVRGQQDRRKGLEDKIRADDQKAQEEVNRMNEEGNKLVKEYMDLTIRAKDASLTAEERGQADTASKAKLEEIKARKAEITAFVENVHNALTQRAAQVRAMFPNENGQDSPHNLWLRTPAGRAEFTRGLGGGDGAANNPPAASVQGEIKLVPRP